MPQARHAKTSAFICKRHFIFSAKNLMCYVSYNKTLEWIFELFVKDGIYGLMARLFIHVYCVFVAVLIDRFKFFIII